MSKYLIPRSRHARRLSGAQAPRSLATFDELADRYPDRVQQIELGYDSDWRSFSYSTLAGGRWLDATAPAEPPFRLRVVCLQGASAVGRHSAVLGPGNELVADLGYYLPEFDRGPTAWWHRLSPKFWKSRWMVDLRSRWSLPPIHKLPGTAVLLNNPWCHNYYHWLLEVVPRLMVLREAGLAADWYVVECQSRYQRRVLELLGVPADRLIQPHFGLHLTADRLIRPSHPGLRHWQALANSLLKAVGVQEDVGQVTSEPCQARRRLYISRRAAAHRKVVDESALESMLGDSGFQSHTFEHLDFAEQVRQIRSSDVIVAVHGAALANLIFARPQTKIVELCPVDRYNTDCFPRLSHKLGHQHYVVLTPCTRFRQQLSVHLDDVQLALQACGLAGVHRKVPRSGLSCGSDAHSARVA